MVHPLVVEVLRGSVVESCHELDAVVVDASGVVDRAWGDGTRAVLPRSALKPLQAIPLVRSGAADVFGLSDPELALAAGSHGGEPIHVAAVDGWLERVGIDVTLLECGAHAPMHRPAADALAAAGRAFDARHNNCSGKHCGFLTLCRHLGLDPSGYIAPDHPLQAGHLTPAIEEWCGVSVTGQSPAIDGCGVPVWSLPLDRLAAGWAAAAAADEGGRILRAMNTEPMMVAGTDRACTRLMAAAPGRAVVKTGAEGVFAATDLNSGVAIALKCRDGATRASDLAIEWLLAEVGVVPTPDPVVLRNWAGTEVGAARVRP